MCSHCTAHISKLNAKLWTKPHNSHPLCTRKALKWFNLMKLKQWPGNPAGTSIGTNFQSLEKINRIRPIVFLWVEMKTGHLRFHEAGPLPLVCEWFRTDFSQPWVFSRGGKNITCSEPLQAVESSCSLVVPLRMSPVVLAVCTCPGLMNPLTYRQTIFFHLWNISLTSPTLF